MNEPAALAEQQLNVLGRLADLGLALATTLQRRALEAEDSHEAAELALAFQRTARVVGQSIALQDRLAREKARDRREREARPVEARQIEARASEPRCASEPDAAFQPEAFRPFGLDDDTLFEHFRNDVLEAIADRLCDKLSRLAPAGEADEHDDEDEDDRRSSPSGGGVGKADGGGFTRGLRPLNPLTGFAGAPPEGEHRSSA
ncbi:hypothetical protein [Phenylobacterium deserti]|nr:hypothetical protein [Phenylobacterium deserti]